MSNKTLDELVKDARARISTMRTEVPEYGIEASIIIAGELELAIDRLLQSLPVGRTADFYEHIVKVEERFRAVYDRETVANAKTEAQMEPARVSLGWFIVLARAGIAIRVGDTKPDYDAGDTVVFTMARLRRKPDAPELVVVPPPEPPIDVETARQVWLDHLATLSPERRAEFAEIISSLPQYVP